ncbi:MAG: ribonucleoside-diphosphate reductase, adenosylcobalamin-dependent, partial [Chloroflexi bacterium]|nr:ribonucleoside-diphosphate reductase, adenosylcobalamin-dependent [Chloroflexota bacterium]
FRPLGLGYANLGALLMARSAPYDSPQGRELASCITAIMTGEAYAQSARIAREVGPFAGYGENRQPMLRVIGKHREAAYRIADDHVESQLLTAARRAWDEAHELGAVHGYRNGQATVLAPTGCLTPDTLVTTSRGLVRLRSLGNPNGAKWQDLDVEVATHEGPRRASKFHVNGVEPVVTVATRRGYRIRGTTTHKVKVVDADGQWQWRRLADVRSGDRVPMMLGGMVGEPVPVALPPLPDAYWTADHETTAPRYVTPELAELVGYFMGDGSLHSKELRFCVSPQDADLAEHLADLGQRLFAIRATITVKPSYIEVAFTSVRLVMWWGACGFAKKGAGDGHRGKGWLAHIPDAVLHTNSPTAYAAFTRGLFEADGTISSGYPSFTTVTESLARDMQALLLALGFVTTLDVHQPGSGSWGARPKYRVRLLNVAVGARFGDEVGFVSARKRALCGAGDHRQSSRHDHVPITRQAIDALAPENDALRKTLLMEYRRGGTVTRRVATALLERTGDVGLRQSLAFFYDEVETVNLGEEDLTLDLSVPDNVTYVANGFVSHNTIGFMMDCDTTGVEPDIALVKYKKLVGGGMLKIVNGTVPLALRRLGYGEAAVRDIVAHIDAKDTIEGAPHLREEDLAVFDCAFKPAGGARSIAWQGHVRMMGAVQPFLSGAISKTVNMPQDATVDDVERAYMDGWKMGLKALAIYRDGSKRSQPVGTTIARTTGAKQIADRPLRRRLPSERQAVTHKFEIGGHEGYITVGLYEDGTPGEIFVKMAKEGSTVSGLMDSFATAISLTLQYGVPLKVLVDKFSHARFEPSGYTGNPEIPIAKSIMDYIFRWLASRFLPWEERDALGIIRRDGTEPGDEPELETRIVAAPATPAARHDVPVVSRTAPTAFLNQEDAPSCSDCGSLMVRSGACYKCLNCGGTSGCS